MVDLEALAMTKKERVLVVSMLAHALVSLKCQYMMEQRWCKRVQLNAQIRRVTRLLNGGVR